MSFADALQAKMAPSSMVPAASEPASDQAVTDQPAGMTLEQFNAAYDEWLSKEASLGRGSADFDLLYDFKDPNPSPTGFDFKEGRDRAMYVGVASGLISIPPSEFDKLLNDNEGGLSQSEFNLLPADVQTKARNDPQRYMQSVLAYRNPANGDLGSVGAEGGFSDYSTAQWDSERGMVPDPSKYMKVNDEGMGWVHVLATVLQFTPLAPLGLALNVGASFAEGDPLSAIVSIAGASGLTSAASGAVGDALGVGKTASDAIVAGGQSAVGSAARGGGFRDVLTAGLTGAASSAVGNTVTDITGISAAGSASSTVTRGLINSALRDDAPARRNTLPASNANPSTMPQITGQNLNLGWMTR